jgi:hypothetical protein
MTDVSVEVDDGTTVPCKDKFTTILRTTAALMVIALPPSYSLSSMICTMSDKVAVLSLSAHSLPSNITRCTLSATLFSCHDIIATSTSHHCTPSQRHPSASAYVSNKHHYLWSVPPIIKNKQKNPSLMSNNVLIHHCLGHSESISLLSLPLKTM